MSLREHVFTALSNATANGYSGFLSTHTVEEITDDLLEHDADLEGEDRDAVRSAVLQWCLLRLDHQGSEMTEEEDALQQAVHDALAGVPYDLSRFPEKSYYWLRSYERELTSRLAAVAVNDDRPLTATERVEARHLLQELSEAALLARNALDPLHGVHTIRISLWRAQLEALTAQLRYFTERAEK
jgi:hypothetical protein